MSFRPVAVSATVPRSLKAVLKIGQRMLLISSSFVDRNTDTNWVLANELFKDVDEDLNNGNAILNWGSSASYENLRQTLDNLCALYSNLLVHHDNLPENSHQDLRNLYQLRLRDATFQLKAFEQMLPEWTIKQPKQRSQLLAACEAFLARERE